MNILHAVDKPIKQFRGLEKLSLKYWQVKNVLFLKSKITNFEFGPVLYKK